MAYKFTLDQVNYIIQVIADNNGNLLQSQRQLESEGIKMSYPTILRYSRKTIKQAEIRKKEAVRLLEINKFNYSETLRQLKDRQILIGRPTLKSWFKKYGKDVCDKQRFKDVVVNLTEEVAISHKALAEKIYEAREKIVDRIILLISDETDMNKLSIAYKTLTEVLAPDGTSKQPLTLINQYNAYYKDRNNGKENRDSGNIQDATPISE